MALRKVIVLDEELKILRNEEKVSDKEIWHTSYDPDFIKLSTRSMVSERWLGYWPVLESGYKDLPIKPINNYIMNMSSRPELYRIDGNTVTLRFSLYADMYLLVSEKDPQQYKGLYSVDRPWMRQYYKTKIEMPTMDDCFEPTYKMLVPWFIDWPMEVLYTPIEDSPVRIQETRDFWHTPNPSTKFVTPHMVPFKFKNTGSHMIDDELGIPRLGDPIFDMHFSLDDIMVERIRNQYAND